jgi:hypothetical protein
MFDIESLPVTITHHSCGEKADWGNRFVDTWRVSITTERGQWQTFYHTGSGLRKDNQPVRPTVADVMYSLMSDSNAEEHTFSDWCDCYGYDNDSIAALNIYKACRKIARKLNELFDHETILNIRSITEEM